MVYYLIHGGTNHIIGPHAGLFFDPAQSGRAGAGGGLGEFHDLYAPVIAGFARRMGARTQDVEDLVQEVLKAFYCVTPEFTYNPEQGKFRGYLRRCVWRERYSGNAERRRTFRAFEMCALLDRATGEVALELGLSVESVRTARSRVSRALREAFEGMDEIAG